MKHLGKKTKTFNRPDIKILDKVNNKNEQDYLIRFSQPEFTSICPITQQPDFAHIIIETGLFGANEEQLEGPGVAMSPPHLVLSPMNYGNLGYAMLFLTYAGWFTFNAMGSAFREMPVTSPIHQNLNNRS